MKSKNIADLDLIKQNLNTWENFFLYDCPNGKIKGVALFLIKMLKVKEDLSHKKTYLNAMNCLTSLMVLKNIRNRNRYIPVEKEKYFQTEYMLTQKQLDSLNKNDLGSNFLRFLFATVYQGTDKDYFDILMSNNPKSCAVTYLKFITDDLKLKKSKETVNELAHVLATEIDIQKNDFIFPEFLGVRALALHFKGLSLFVAIEKIDGTTNFSINYTEILNIRGHYLKNHYRGIVVNNSNPYLLGKGSTKEILNYLLKSDEILRYFIRSIDNAKDLSKKN